LTAVFLLVELPSCLQLTLSWGASTLWTKQVELPCDLAIGEIGARLQGDRRGCELRTATRVQPIRSEQRVSLESDGFILSIDAVTDDIAPALPSHVDPRAAAFDLGSLLLHGALAVMLFLLADPLADQKLEPLEELIIPHAGKVMDLGVVLPTDQPVDKVPGGHRAVDDKPDGAAGPGASTRAAHGAARQPSAGGNYTARPEASAHDGLSDVETWSMITLLGRAAAGSKDPSSGKDPWSGAGLDSGPSWGDPGGIGDDGGSARCRSLASVKAAAHTAKASASARAAWAPAAQTAAAPQAVSSRADRQQSRPRSDCAAGCERTARSSQPV